MTITGTCYFPSKDCAINYYYPQIQSVYETKIEVEKKISDGSIFIGKPVLKSGQILFVRDNRYLIQENV